MCVIWKMLEIARDKKNIEKKIEMKNKEKVNIDLHWSCFGNVLWPNVLGPKILGNSLGIST